MCISWQCSFKAIHIEQYLWWVQGDGCGVFNVEPPFLHSLIPGSLDFHSQCTSFNPLLQNPWCQWNVIRVIILMFLQGNKQYWQKNYNPMQNGWDTHQNLAIICAISLVFNDIAFPLFNVEYVRLSNRFCGHSNIEMGRRVKENKDVWDWNILFNKHSVSTLFNKHSVSTLFARDCRLDGIFLLLLPNSKFLY